MSRGGGGGAGCPHLGAFVNLASHSHSRGRQWGGERSRTRGTPEFGLWPPYSQALQGRGGEG